MVGTDARCCKCQTMKQAPPCDVRRPCRLHNIASKTQVGLKALYEIAKVKNAETHSVLLPLESVCKSVRATALSMGLEIVDDRESLKRKDDDL